MATKPTKLPTLEPGFTPLFPGSPPLDLKQWPPPAYRAKHRVRLGEDWQTIAHHHLMVDPLDLVFYNFRTTDPREINWYLRHYIGCWAAGPPDRKFFMFTNYDDPGFVYIPPLGYKRDFRMPFHGRVVQQLEKAVPHYPTVALRNYSVGPETLRKVIEAMRIGRIYCFHEPNMKRSENARYIWRRNRLEIRRPYTESFQARRTIVHEATHAVVDYKSYDLWYWESELIAFTVAALWARAVDNERVERFVNSDPPFDLINIYQQAYVLAHYLSKKRGTVKRIEDFDKVVPEYRDSSRMINPYVNLMSAIQHDENYARRAWLRTTHDGV